MKNLCVRAILAGVLLMAAVPLALSEETVSVVPAVADMARYAAKATDELLRLSWDALNRADYPELEKIYEVVVQEHEPLAMTQHSALIGFPPRDKTEDYKVMNDVATIHFVRLEALRMQGMTEEAVAFAQSIIKKYPYGQSWDASRGGYWSVAEKSRIIMDQLTGITAQKEEAARHAPLTKPELAFPGKDRVVDYTKYGKFTGIGTRDYKYQMGNPAELAAAIGQGIYPNTADVLKDPRYREVYKEGRLNGSHWDHVNTRDLEAAFYKWATAADSPGIKLFYTGLVFERAEMFVEAIKAYHAVAVHFPSCSGMTYWQTPWYPASAAVAKIKNIIRFHPELELEYVGGKVSIINGADKDLTNDVFVTDPGVIRTALVPGSGQEKMTKLGAVKRRIGGRKVQFVQYANGHWRMLVNGKPFMIQGITYAPTKIGQTPDKGTLENWMFQEADSAHNAWVDQNRNHVQDPDELAVGDFTLMKEMGVNTLRIYHNNVKINKELLRELYNTYGIMVIMGDFVGKYALGSGVDWATGTDYDDPAHLANMIKSVEQMVTEFKDEPFVLMWLLGNENNYGVASNADKKPDAYFKFLNEVAKRIKQIDPQHPVAVCNGDTLFLDKMAQFAPAIDAYGANVYRGDYGFGSFWDEVRQTVDRPAFITEYGAPAYSKFSSLEDAEKAQADYHQSSWMDIKANSAGYAGGEGNAVGGVAFEWVDEWWKNYEPMHHDTKADVIGPFAGGYYFEEWFGLTSQGDGSQSPLLRELRQAYFMYQKAWTEK